MKRLIAAAATCAAAGACAVPALASTRTVRVEDNVFAPKSIAVAKGTTVKWLFRGEKPHNVVVERGPVKFRVGAAAQRALQEEADQGRHVLDRLHDPQRDGDEGPRPLSTRRPGG